MGAAWGWAARNCWAVSPAALRPLRLGTAAPSLSLAQNRMPQCLYLRIERTKSGEQLRRDSVPMALKSSVALTINRHRWACELSSSSTPSQARWGVRLLAADAPRGKHAPTAVHGTRSRAVQARQAPERGGERLTRQAEAGGTSHRHPVSGPRGCRALPPHFPWCSLGAFRRICADMASGEGWGRRRARSTVQEVGGLLGTLHQPE